MRSYLVIPGLFLTTLSSFPALAEMSKGVARSAGSFFAAAIACEQRDKIQKGQTEALLADLDRFLTPVDKKRMKLGSDRGARLSAVFIPITGWIPFSPDDDGCFRVQGVLDDYRMRLSNQ